MLVSIKTKSAYFPTLIEPLSLSRPSCRAPLIVKDNRIYRGLYQDGHAIYNADSVGAFNILRKYYQENNIKRKLTYKCLSNPKKVSTPVTSNSAKKEVGIVGRNCPDSNMLIK